MRKKFNAERSWATAEKLLSQLKCILAYIFHNKSYRINCCKYFLMLRDAEPLLRNCWVSYNVNEMCFSIIALARGLDGWTRSGLFSKWIYFQVHKSKSFCVLEDLAKASLNRFQLLYVNSNEKLIQRSRW